MRGIVDAVFIQNERVRQRANFQQPMPVGRVARQSRDFQSQHNAGATHADFSDELLKTFAVHSRSTRLAEIGIDNDNLFFRPSERDGRLPERILPLRAFRILEDLPHRRLTHVQIGIPLEVGRGNLLVRLRVHQCISCVRLRAILARI